VAGSILLSIAAGACWWLAPTDLALAALGVLCAAVAVAGGCWWWQRSAHSQEQSASADSGDAPFLQRMIAASASARRAVEARQDQLARTTSAVLVGVDDFELGKTLHRWRNGRVQRGRQKSLDRPVLIWQETQAAPEGEPQPVVRVRHPSLLGLYAVGAGPEGRFLVTEPTTATPLADIVGRLSPVEAATLTARLARIIAAMHEQGACHGRLSLDWILLRGELTPALCPHAIPCQSAEDRRRDVQALGELFLAVSHAHPAEAEPQLEQLGEAARRGEYAEATDLARDLERTATTLRNRWRARLSTGVVIALAALPWLLLAAGGESFAPMLLAALAPSSMLLGYTQARALLWRQRLGRRLVQKNDLAKALLPLLLVTLPAPLLAGIGPLASAFPGDFGVRLFMLAQLVICWLAGGVLAGLVTAGEMVGHTLRPTTPGR
jgi:hypothetical protein